jgi:hypothetical protein
LKNIYDKRKKELEVLGQGWRYAVANITCLYLVPALLQTAIFTGAIYFNGSVSLAEAFLIMNILRMLIDPIRSLP